ncbi:MAG: hypothetical protein WBD40_15995 [Tepidisphaeraceae bacterium]
MEPKLGCPWADEMVLNPAFIADPVTDRLHMLFRASGPWPQKRRDGQPLPYPIFLGYAWSDDGGETWEADFSRPALAPALHEEADKLVVVRADGRRVVNHANGCIEDPRLFWLEGQLYLTTACRMFPPGPYWEGTALDCCVPDWAKRGRHDLGSAATNNVTVSVLWHVDLEKLIARRYEEAFAYVTHLTDPERGDNRDVFLFPEKLTLNGRSMYVCLHRPWNPSAYDVARGVKAPSIMLAAADELDDLATDAAEQHLLATPALDWESNRIGASWPPIRLNDGEWLLAHHGKSERVGYTQSFMVLREQDRGWPVITHRCGDRLMYAKQEWELNGKFPTPVLFTCAGQRVGSDLIMTYGAADTKAGVAWTDFDDLVRHVRQFDASGKRTAAVKATRPTVAV